jgi:nicotinate dehydrogenase subunit A
VIDLIVNGQSHSVSADPETPLLYVLRNDLQLNAAKFGCGLGQCGACTVLVDGAPTMSCVTPILLVAGRQITTVEGLGTEEKPGPMQQAFIEEQAAQCGFCIAGMMLRAQALLQGNPNASEAEIRAQLEPNLCRCGTHMRILRAVRRAASLMQGAPLRSNTPDPQGQQPEPATESDGWQRRAHGEERERPER